MKKFLNLLVLIALMLTCFIGISFAVDNTLYTAAISTKTISVSNPTNLGAPNINLATVNVKRIDITNPTAVAQTITIYGNATSTTALTTVYSFAVPATIGTFTIPMFDGKESVWSSHAEYVNIPYFAVRTSTNVVAAAAKINVKYWK